MEEKKLSPARVILKNQHLQIKKQTGKLKQLIKLVSDNVLKPFQKHSLYVNFKSFSRKRQLQNIEGIENFSAYSQIKSANNQLYKHFTRRNSAFSLVEMLMALLVASLLMAALAPVMTKRFNENVTIDANVSSSGEGIKKTYEIEFGSDECSEIKTDSDGSEYCEGEYSIPSNFSGAMKVTVVGAGGGGGIAPTAGYVEYTTAGSTNSFTVPAMVKQIEATLIGGGAGGGAASWVETYKEWKGGQITTWTAPNEVMGKIVKVTACGGGGGGGSAFYNSSNPDHDWVNAGGGGSGGYLENVIKKMPNSGSLSIVIGGGGGAGGHNNSCGNNGHEPNGGGGGSECGATSGGTGGSAGGGNGGRVAPDITTGASNTFTVAQGGSGGVNGTATTTSALGKGGSGGAGGNGGNAWDWDTLYNNENMGGGSGGTLGGGGGGGGTGGSKGGGGGGATQISGFTNGNVLAPGGGGGLGIDMLYAMGGSGGGGGGGTGGGFGGHEPHLEIGRGGGGGQPGGGHSTWCWPGVVKTPWSDGRESNFCIGGYGMRCAGNNYGDMTDGKDGAARIYYASSTATGGSGGGGGAIVPYQSINVTPKENLSIQIANIAIGQGAGGYNSSGIIVYGQGAEKGNVSTIKRGTDVLLNTDVYHGAFGGWNEGSCTINHTCRSGSVFDGISTAYSNNWNGAYNVNGLAAGNRPYGTTTPGTANSTGGRGGYTNVFGEQFCTPGEGGTASHPDGYNGTGYGCGGGGGSHGGRGGSGSGGYARISWNNNWNASNNNYDIKQNLTGGGGASGNIMSYSIYVRGNEKIKIRIGKGGSGAYVLNNNVISAKNGGMTSFASGASREIRAGGGKAGGNPVVTFDSSNNVVITAGDGGSISDVCWYKKNFFNTDTKGEYCTKGIAGERGTASKGGKGADFIGYQVTEANNSEINITGTGGNSGVYDTGSNSSGKNADGYGAGGGGAALRNVSKVNSNEAISNPNSGGNGSNGRIMLEWYENR